MAAALTVTDELALPLRAVGDLAAAAEVSREEVVVITQCVSLGGKFPFDDASVGAVLSVIKKVESLGDQLIAEISRVLKAGGTVLVQSFTPSSNQKVTYLNWFWSMGSSFPLKKTTKALPKIQIDDDTELIDEDSLLTEEDLKKPQLPVVGDCEVGATRKACKNCTCGRAQGRTHRVCRVGHGIPWGPAGSRAQYQRAPTDGSPADCRTRCLDPLKSLIVDGCPKLSALPDGMECLTALRNLHISHCPRIKSLPHGLLRLRNLERLNLENCPSLQKRCRREEEYRDFVSHIRDVDLLDEGNNKGWSWPFPKMRENGCEGIRCIPGL